VNLYVTLDVDPDFENPGRGVEGALEGIRRCTELFRELSLSEHVTWLVNNTELHLTERHEVWLAKMSDGEIGMHLHLNRPVWAGTWCTLPSGEGAIRRAIEAEKERLDRWLVKNLGYEVISFRSGNLLTSPELFRALENTGIRVDSSLPAQFDWSLREVARRAMNFLPGILKRRLCRKTGYIYPTLPLGRGPFWMGEVLEMPLHVYAGGRYLKEDTSWVVRRTQAHLERGVTELVIYWHPHEIAGRERQISGYIEYLLELGMKPRRLRDAEDILL